MPVREKAVGAALREITEGHVTYNNLPTNRTATVFGVQMPREEFDERFWKPIDRAFEVTVEHIDWGRVMIEAMQRHVALGHDEDGDKYSFPFTEQICADCLQEALLCGRTYQDWAKEPKAERRYR